MFNFRHRHADNYDKLKHFRDILTYIVIMVVYIIYVIMINFILLTEQCYCKRTLRSLNVPPPYLSTVRGLVTMISLS